MTTGKTPRPAPAPTGRPVTLTVPLLQALDDAWAAIRQRHPELPEVVVTIGSGTLGERGEGRLGHYATGRWHRDGTELPELFIAGEGLDRPAGDILGTLLHEAAHGLAAARNINDTSRQGRYHNTRYADLAREVGLDVAQDPRRGWAITTVPAATADQYAAYADAIATATVAVRQPETRSISTGRASNNNPVPARCACPRRIRVAPSVLDLGPITCGICSTTFQPDA